MTPRIYQGTHINTRLHHTKILCESFLKMPKPTKQVSDHINCSLNTGINKFSRTIKLQSRQMPSYPLFPISHQKIYFPINSLQACTSPSWWQTESPLASEAGTRHCCAALQRTYLQKSGCLHICKTVCPKECQLPHTCPHFPVGSMPAAYCLGDHKTRRRRINNAPGLGKVVGSSQVVVHY